MPIQPSDCSVFIQVWVDTNAAVQGSTAGIYLVDNQANQGSSGEGTPVLVTHATQNSNVCFSVLNIDPQSSAALQLANVSSSNAFGFNGSPLQVTSTVWTGTLAKGVTADYSLVLNVVKASGESLTTQVNPKFQIA